MKWTVWDIERERVGHGEFMPVDSYARLSGVYEESNCALVVLLCIVCCTWWFCCGLFSAQYCLCSVYSALGTVLCTSCTVHSFLCTVHCAQYSVHSAVGKNAVETVVVLGWWQLPVPNEAPAVRPPARYLNLSIAAQYPIPFQVLLRYFLGTSEVLFSYFTGTFWSGTPRVTSTTRLQQFNTK